ncbi:MAG TPA: 2'-5' RNA ligase family protein [Ilumatobacter sp.]
MTRLFVAVWPSEQARQHVRSLPRDGWVNVRWTPEDNWHVTLAFVGEAELDEIAGRLGGGDYPAVTAEVASRMRVMGRSNLVVPVSGVDSLADAVRARVFDEPPQQQFRGHLTVGRSIGRRLISGKSKSGQVLEPVTFDVDEIALVRSTLSPDGARYDTVSTFACR